jgi:hypothetical protein
MLNSLKSYLNIVLFLTEKISKKKSKRVKTQKNFKSYISFVIK